MEFQKGVRDKTKKDLVTFSARAQDFIAKRSQKGDFAARTTDDITGIGLAGSVDTTNASYIGANDSSILAKNSKYGLDNLGPLQLPKINHAQQSPFKGFIDISVVSQKMRRDLGTSGRMTRGPQSVKGKGAGLLASTDGHPVKSDPFFGGDDYGQSKNQKQVTTRGKTQSGERNVKMNPKVLETWIDETLRDAEHLDIPGVILKPEHKNPIQRYGIDRIELEKAGIDMELADRIYRALFVYSVGFYELIKKCLAHTGKKYTIITAIWKVFSILLEYCCRTDYRMLIQEISKEYEQKMEDCIKKYDQQFQDQANKEKTLKQNFEAQQKHSEQLEKDRQNERQMRLKLEEEYMQNTKNHEEEVQLRLKFESKLNNMHSAHRDLETKFKRTRQDLEQALKDKSDLQAQNNKRIEEITVLKTKNTDQESKITSQKERIDSLMRDLQIKSDQLKEFEDRNARTMDELDLCKYKLQEQQKDLTDLRLKSDVLRSTNDGLKSEKDHLTIELRETRILQKSYETKTNELMAELSTITAEFQETKRQMVGHNEMTREREERIEKLKERLHEVQEKFDALTIEHGTLQIEHSKNLELYNQCSFDLEDTTEKLHATNKVRHETEIKLGEEIEKTKGLQDIVKLKEDTLMKKAAEIEELDKKNLDLERQNEVAEIKREGIERTASLTKKQLTEKIQTLNEMLVAEKETREMWIDRYEKEQDDNTKTKGELLQAKSEHKDALLEIQNLTIKLDTNKRQLDILAQQNKKFQASTNETMAKSENVERELNTQKEIMKQFEASKKDYINKLKRELDTIEDKFLKVINQNQMLEEDFRSQAGQNYHKLMYLQMEFKEQKQTIIRKEEEIQKTKDAMTEMVKVKADDEMEWEDHTCQIIYKGEKIDSQSFKIESQSTLIDSLQLLKSQNNETIAEQGTKLKDTTLKLGKSVKEAADLSDNVKQLHDDLAGEKQEKEAKIVMYKDIIEKMKKQQEEDRESAMQNKVEIGEPQFQFTQTEIGMDYFDRERSAPKLAKQDSRGSQAASSKGSRVGGGGTISKPPRQQTRQMSGNEADMNISGSQQKPSEMSVKAGSTDRKHTGSRAETQNSKQALPNLLKSGSKQNSSILGKDSARMLKNDSQGNTLEEGDNSTAQGTIKHGTEVMATIIQTNSIGQDDITISQSQAMLRAGQETLDPDFQNQVIKEEDNENEAANPGIITKKSSSGKKVDHVGFSSVGGNQGQAVRDVSHATTKKSNVTLSKQSSFRQENGADSRNDIPLNNQNRMKVNINNQEMVEENENSYMSHTAMGQPLGQNQIMQPQMVQVNKNLNSGGAQRQNLSQSREQNKRKVIGASNIRTLIKSAATRD